MEINTEGHGLMRDAIVRQVAAMVSLADAMGFIITVEQKPLQPLAMRNYKTVVSVREKRHETI